MDKIIATALLVIAAVVGVGLVVNATLPAINRSSGAVLQGAGKIDERIKTQIEIIEIAPELDSSGQWQNTYGNADANFDIFVWVKNVGAARITAVESCAIWLGGEGSISYITYGGAGFPRWTYTVEGGGEWGPSATARFTIVYSTPGGSPASPLTSGSYLFKLSTPNGITDEDYYVVS